MNSIERETTRGQGESGRFLTVQGGLLRSFARGEKDISYHERVSRGTIKEFSRQSRRRLMNFVASIDYGYLGRESVKVLFITLTTAPDQWWDLKRFYVAGRRFDYFIQKQSGYLAHIIKRERGKKGMLHYHLMVFGTSFIPVNEMRRAWTKAMESQLVLRVGVEQVRSPEELSIYLAKYVTKMGYEGSSSDYDLVSDASSGELASPDGESEVDLSGDDLTLSKGHNGKKEKYEGHTGSRWWYVRNAESLPICEEEEIFSADNKVVSKNLRRIARKYLIRRAQIKNAQRVRDEFEKIPLRVEKEKIEREAARIWGLTRRECHFVSHLRGFYRFFNEKRQREEMFRTESFTLYASPDVLTRLIECAMEM